MIDVICPSCGLQTIRGLVDIDITTTGATDVRCIECDATMQVNK